jgi:hypothetical protein
MIKMLSARVASKELTNNTDRTELWDIPGDSCMLASINIFFGVIMARTLKEMATEVCLNKNSKTGKFRLMYDIKQDEETGEPIMLMNVYKYLRVNHVDPVGCSRRDVVKHNTIWSDMQAKEAIITSLRKSNDERKSLGAKKLGSQW